MDMAIFRNLLIFPSHGANGLPYAPLSLPKQAITILMFLSVYLDRVLVDIFFIEHLAGIQLTASPRAYRAPTHYISCH
jgi:hypothetical protein